MLRFLSGKLNGTMLDILPFNRVLAKPEGCGRFSSPLRKAFSIHRGTLPQSRIRSTAPSGRELGMGAYHSMCRSETVGLRAIFIAPTKLRIFNSSKIFRFLPGEGYRVGQGTYVWEPAPSVTKNRGWRRGCRGCRGRGLFSGRAR